MTALFPPDSNPPEGTLPLDRRGVLHGFVDATTPVSSSTALADDWNAGRPIRRRAGLEPAASEFREWIEAGVATFERLRDGGRWLEECEARLEDCVEFVYAGSTVDHSDAREIERLFVDVMPERGRKPIARDITARLSWIADDETDLSMRARFSFGHESLKEWLDPTDDRWRWADHLAESVFPECAVLSECDLLSELESIHGGPLRCSERIVYSNAPGGGAVFHHDADPAQRGVLFGQLAGQTAWLALPKSELAAAVAGADGSRFGSTEEALGALDKVDEQLWTLLNMTPEFTAHLAEAGALFVLSPGDALVLPSPNESAVAWHSVFALGESASLAHSYGLFDAPTESE